MELEEGWVLETRKFSSISDLDEYSEKHWDYNYNYQRLVLKPTFRVLDYCIIPIKIGVVVSERLKDAIEDSGLIGINFRALPRPLEFSDEI